MITDPQLQRLAQQLTPIIDSLRPAPVFIGARYTTNAGQSIPNAAYTVVNFEDVSYDPLSLVTTGAGWVFTAPIAGYYRVSAAVLFVGSAAWGAGEIAAMALFVNGSQVNALQYLNYGDYAPGVATQAGVGGSDVVALAQNDTLNVHVLQTTGGALALFGDGLFNYVSIARIG